MSLRRRLPSGRALLGVFVIAAFVACGSSTPAVAPQPASSTTVAAVTSTTRAPSTADTSSDPTDPDPTPSSSVSRPPATTPGPLEDGPVTIVTVGDSLTEGDGDDDSSHGYPERLQRVLDASDREGSTVINLGRSGWSTTQLLEGQDSEPSQLSLALTAIREAKAADQPAIVLVLIGSNDLWYLYANEAPTTAADEEDDLDHYRSSLEQLTEDLTGAGAVVVLGINDDQSQRPVAADAAMRRLAFPDISDAEVAQMSAQAERYAAVVREVADGHGALVADFLHASFFTDPARLADDGAHPNTAGYDAMTQIWLTVLEPLIG